MVHVSTLFLMMYQENFMKKFDKEAERLSVIDKGVKYFSEGGIVLWIKYRWALDVFSVRLFVSEFRKEFVKQWRTL